MFVSACPTYAHISAQDAGLVTDTAASQFETYIQTIGGAARTDNVTSLTTFTLRPLIDSITDNIKASDIGIPIAGAVFLASLGFIAIVNEWTPKRRFYPFLP